MTTIKDIFTIYAPEYIHRFGEAIPFEHRKVINAIINCRTDHYGVSIYQCTQCGENHMVYCCCGNRHCPNCQYHKTRKWLQRQLDRQLPGHHFMITFTVPQTSGASSAVTSRCATRPCLPPLHRQLKNWRQIKDTLAQTCPGSLGCFIPGAVKCPIIHTSIISSRGVHFPKPTANGTALESISFCQSRPCQKSSRPNSATL